MVKTAKLNKNGRFNSTITPIKLDISHGELPPQLIAQGFVRSSRTMKDLADGSVEEAYSAYMLNRIPGHLRMAWMDDLWRVLVPNGKATIIVPYWTSPRSIQDPNSQWPPLCEQSFLYFNKKFREDNKEPQAKCDFDFVYGYQLDPETAGRNDETRPFWIKHYANAVSDLQVVLTKRL